jgi:hypothetical protein
LFAIHKLYKKKQGYCHKMSCLPFVCASIMYPRLISLQYCPLITLKSMHMKIVVLGLYHNRSVLSIFHKNIMTLKFSIRRIEQIIKDMM